ncbi:Na+/H+ antiporter subunit D [Actinomadura madurae]|uniref:Na+/H+ antiporter subunit D n=2 Tax=Actinomadura madurae TaxID=1993 RepID=UPI0020D24F13|nr:Na+/H+ antiporter subunit D [Actinomadura madurae]MCP9954707.1 Na+/H+ antiporter subunit D [Actinomadura madurae]MCP9971446.1 Na+/H+ antiporter subunit D [Actinomadura madurae]MCP9983937.1 Na+/H+ antiporter subunit D [Actinomadura madurae]MCQ0004497.1 Na+/H+ antiporter subunit D [Actinomadura madurae]
MTVLVPLPFVLPLLGAALALISRRRKVWLRVLAPLVAAGVVGAAAALLAAVAREGVLAVQIGGWAAPLGITLVADRLSALLLVVSAAVLLAILVHAVAEGAGGLERRTEPGVFHPAYLALTAGVSLVFLAGDLFNLFVAFEIMLASSYVLMTLTPTAERLRAGMTYTVVSLTSSILFLTALGLTYAAAGTVNLADLSERVPDLPAATRTALGLLFLVVFGIKGAIVPMHMWLPDSYPVALTKVTAVFAALLTKAAVYSLIRVETLVFPREDGSRVMLVLAAGTMLVGTLGALTHDDIHRVFSFTLVGHIGYMLFGLALFSVAGLTGAILYLVHHIVVQATLFLVSDLMQARTGETSLRRLGGLARLSAFIAVVFFVPAMSVSGVPPTSGFVAKLALFQAGLGAGRPMAYAVTGVAVLASVLTLMAMARIWTLGFWRPRPEDAGEPPSSEAYTPGGVRVMRSVTAVMVVGGLVIAVIAGPLSSWSRRAAADLVDPAPYRQAVLDGRTP